MAKQGTHQKSRPRKQRKPAGRSNFKWEDKSDTAFLSVKNQYDEYSSEYHVHIYKVDGEQDYTWEIVGPFGPQGGGECKKIQEGKTRAVELLGKIFNLKNMVNA